MSLAASQGHTEANQRSSHVLVAEMVLRLAIAFALAALVFFPSATARAYCRTHTLDDSVCPAPAECTDVGIPIAWHTSQMWYGLNERGFPGLTDAQLRATLAAATQAWQAVTCNGRSIGLQLHQLSGSTPLEEGPAPPRKDAGIMIANAEPNENVITHYDAEAWAAKEYSSRAFAVTAVWFYTQTGRITGADVGLNGGWDQYGDCAVDMCTSAGGVRTDLQNVMTHEFGHFLGLAHSPVRGSTMSCDAEPTATDKRTLDTDDIDGICAVYPPGSLPRDPQTVAGVFAGTCSAAEWRGGEHFGSFAFALGFVLAAFVLRRCKLRS